MKFLSFSSVAIYYVTHEVMLLKTFSLKRSPQAPKSKPPAYYVVYKGGERPSRAFANVLPAPFHGYYRGLGMKCPAWRIAFVKCKRYNL